MFVFLSKLLDIFFSPLTWGLLFLAAAVPWRAGAKVHLGRRRAYGLLGLVVLLSASSSPIAHALLWRLEHSTASTYRDDVTYDAVVLLGGVVDEEASAVSRQPSYNDNVERLVMTHRLLRDNKARFVILSGATSNPKYADFGESAMLARQLEEWGIKKDRIILESHAWNTHENAVFSQEIARARRFERVLIVTSAFHMVRAEECFVAVGMKVDTLAVDYRGHEHPGTAVADWLPRASALAITSSVTREMFGRLVYRAQGYGIAARP